MGEVVYDMPIDEYHSHPAISRSGITTFLRSPQHYWWNYLSGKAEKKETDALRIGGAFHALALEPDTFNNRYLVWSGKPRNTAEGRESYSSAQAEAKGRTLIKQSEFDEMKLMAESLISQPASKKIIDRKGKIESSFFWTDDEFKVKVKARPDYWRDDGIVLDLKTVSDAGREAFEKSIVSYGYDIQAFMQLEGIEKVTGKRPESFVFCCVEKEPPYAVAFYSADETLIECGRQRYSKIISRYAECKRLNVWPGYGSLVQPIGVPKWFEKRIIENGE